MEKLGRILIAGGGIAGLTLAAAMRRRGFDQELVERSTAWEAVGAGIAVQPNGMRALRALGIDTMVEQAGSEVRRWLFRDQHGEVLCDIDLESLWGDVGPFIGIARAKLQEALLSAAATPCRLGVWVTALSKREDRVAVNFSDGSSGEYDVVIGADGIFSTVRQLTLNAFPPVYGGQMVWRSLAPIRPGGLTSLQFWLGDGCFFGLCPVGDRHTYGFANLTGPRMQRSGARPAAALARPLRRFWRTGPGISGRLARGQANPLRADRMAGGGRVALRSGGADWRRRTQARR